MDNNEMQNVAVGTPNEGEGAYRYTYRALTPDQRREAESILREYEQPTENVESDFQRLQRLQNRIERILAVFGLSFGVVGCLIFGGGLSMVLLNIEQLVLQVCGGVLCVLGVVVMAATYPLHRRLEKRLKEKHKEEIVQRRSLHFTASA